MKKLKLIPKFKSIQEEATFWDAHDTTEFANAFTPVEVKFGKNLLAQGITIRFDYRTLSLLRKKPPKKESGQQPW